MEGGREAEAARALEELKRHYAGAADEVVPWFYANMPDFYFRTHTPGDRLLHLKAAVAGRFTGEPRTVLFKSPCGTRHTFISPGRWIKEFLAVVGQFERDRVECLQAMSSADGAIRVIDVVTGPGPRCDPKGPDWRRALAMMRRAGLVPAARMPAFREFLKSAGPDYLARFEPARAARHFDVARRMAGREQVETALEPLPSGEERLTVSLASPPAAGLAPRLIRILARHAVDIDRAYCDLFSSASGTLLLCSFYVRCGDACLSEDRARLARVMDDLRRAKWRPPHALDALIEEDGWDADRVERVHAMCDFAHQMLVRENIHAFSSDNVVRAVLARRAAAAALEGLFAARHDPRLERREDAVRLAEEEAARHIEAEEDDVARAVLAAMRDFARRTLRTNAFAPSRLGLSFRLDPAVVADPIGGQRPYGIYFFHGPHSLGFHIRFRDTARGGLRLVPARSQAAFELESARLFDECAALARTQQDKNKDIPEGGAKAVLLLGPRADPEVALRAMIDAFLDLLVTDGERPVGPMVADHLGRREIIFLGPDENITPERIDWIVARAARRGYSWPQAFMSSKRRTGINHKQYAVTSRGVLVFVEELLRALGVDPARDPFTLTMTGGPRGDVASGLMRLLAARRRGTARILAVADGSGAAHDPAGLDMDELLRLADAEASIAAFDPARLRGPGAFVTRADTPEGARLRSALHNTVRADVFVPAGGRPDTINARNWRAFLDEDGRPAARGVVEGANIFISDEARERLQEAGVLIVPGASANKTGVICSSYEILAGLALDARQLLAARRRFVPEVLAILARRAADEARALFRERRASGGRESLSSISRRISEAVNGLADALLAAAEEAEGPLADKGLVRELILDYCPPVLARRHAEEVLGRVPLGHLLALAAHHAAARLVYAEGPGWVEGVCRLRAPAEVARAWLAHADEAGRLDRELRRARLAGRGVVRDVVAAGAARRLAMRDLGLA